jgi:N-acetylglutamate synthase-like GNAT family acetyltransferase
MNEKNINIIEVLEWELSFDQELQVAQLIATSFPGYPKGMSYYNQLPSFRVLAYASYQLVGHLAVHNRIISILNKPYRIWGIADICVLPQFREQGIGGELLDYIIKKSNQSNISYLLSISNEHPIYTKRGFTAYDVKAKWMMTNQLQSMGIIHRNLKDCLYIHPLNESVGQQDLEIDFLGVIF